MTKALVVFFLLLTPLKGYGQEEMLIGLIPEENIFKQMDRHRPLAAYLSNKLGLKVKLTILSKYGDIIDKFTSRNMNGAFFGDFTAVLAMEKLAVEPVARPVSLQGSSTIRSYLFVRHDSGIKSVKEMRGKRMAFVDRATATGYLFAVALLRENGVRDIERYFKEFYFTGSHDSAIYAVLDNRADIGTADSKVFNRMVEKDPTIKSELIIIAKSEEFPDTTLCLRKDMPKELKDKIATILLTMDKDQEGIEVLRKLHASKFIGASKKDFLPFAELARKAGMSVRDYRYK